jgi:hypothetical protein
MAMRAATSSARARAGGLQQPSSPHINGEVVENCDTCSEGAINGQCRTSWSARLADENPFCQLVACLDTCASNDRELHHQRADAYPTASTHLAIPAHLL